MSHHRRERTLSASLGRISLHFAGKINFEAQILDGKETLMKTYRKELWFQVPTRRAFINITPEVVQALRESGIQEGLCLVNAMHITASVFINDDESGLHHDYEHWLEELAPHAPIDQYRHNRTGEDNADAHLKRQIMGREVVVAVTNGRLDFGTWEQIFYGEFDGRRRKRVLVKIIGE
jgi:secondary thiamine-phosphate synthase enzyme